MEETSRANYAPKIQLAAEARERAEKERRAVKSLYMNPDSKPLLDDLLRFIETQSQGCKDKAVITDNELISTRSLHMLLMADIIKSYIENQRKV